MTAIEVTEKEYLSNKSSHEYFVKNELVNPDLFKIFEYCNINGVKPNVTINGDSMSEKYYNLLVKHCGAVAVSFYDDDICFNAVKELSKRGLKQVNIHCMLSETTYDDCFELMKKTKTDSRLKDLNAIVFLLMKPKGNRNHYKQLRDKKKYGELVKYAIDNGISVGFDSCGCPAFVEWAKENGHEDLVQLTESCESLDTSVYVSCDGRVMPCSFCDSKDKPGIDITNIKSSEDFVKDVWNSKMSEDFRESKKLNIDKNGCINCPKFNLYME